MEIKKFLGLANESIKLLFENFNFIFAGFLLWGLIFIFSKISVFVNHRLDTTAMLIAWLVLFSLVSLIAMSFVFSGIIGMSKEYVKRNGGINFLRYGKKFVFRNFVILLIIFLITLLIGRTAHYGALYIGQLLNFELGAARFLFILIYFIGLVGLLIFLTFSSFFLVIYDLKIKESIKKSANLVKREYLTTLGINISIFVVLFLLNKINGIFVEIIEYSLFIPLYILILTRLVLYFEKNDI